jgi:hypothetical protein
VYNLTINSRRALMENLKALLEKANVVSWAGGDSRPILKKIDTEIDHEGSFCTLSRKKVHGVLESLNEMADLFLGESMPRGIRTEKFLNCKADILEILALGVAYQNLK